MKETIAGNLVRYRNGLGLSQEQLAERIEVTRQSINNYEKAKTLPDSKTLSALARALGVTFDDLLRPAGEGLPNFRFRAHASFDNRPQFAAKMLRMPETYNSLEQAVGLSPYAPESTPVHQVEGNEKRIQDVAIQFRHRLRLGDAPIFNLFEAVEEIGLKVLRQSVPLPNFFGLSACSAEQGAFVLVNNQGITIERQLFTLAHEIGHLIFHRGDYQDTLVETGTKEEEKAREEVANYFTGHLLVPQFELERVYELTQNLVKLKQHFRVSYQVILVRLAQMGVVDYSQEIKKIKSIYKKQHNASLKKNMELPPALDEKEFLENQRFVQLVWKALELGKISEMKASELLDFTVEDLRMRRREEIEFYVP